MTDTTFIRRPPPWLFLRGILGYSFYFFFTVAFICLLPPIILLFSWNRKGRQRFIERLFGAFGYFLSRVYLPALGIYSITEESGFENLSSTGPAVIVANHRSRMDAPFLLPLLENTGVVIKSTYTRRPFFAALVRHLNFVSVNPNSLSSLTGSIHRCEELLAQGKRLLIFPEGTRAAGARMGEFKDLAFRLAMEADVPVIPVVLHTSLPFMTKIRGSVFPHDTFSVTLRMLPPERPVSGERAADFAWRISKLIAAHLQELDKETVWESRVTPGYPPHRPAAPRSSSTSVIKDTP